MKKNNVIISICLIILAIAYTFIVKFIDVQAIGPEDSSVGLASFNNMIFNIFGVNMNLYKFTNIIGVIPVLIVFAYFVIGLVQVIQRKNVLKVDKELLVLGIFYIVTIIIYFIFEFLVINYRPILMDGELDPSYPSSHTMLAIFICISSVILNKSTFGEIKILKIVNVISIITMICIVIGRWVSGVHWTTDIMGGIIFAVALIMSYYTVITSICSRRNDEIKNN